MELKLTKEEISTKKAVFNAVQEQAVELDYVLPDYYPEIHKIIKCTAEPYISSRSISDTTLSYEITLILKILYCSENSTKVNVIDQKLMYSKSVELQQNTAAPEIKISAVTDYVNCRAINSRRIDLRGAITTEISVYDIAVSQLVSDASGMGIQLMKIPVTYPANSLFAEKQISVTETIELGSSKPAIDGVVYFDSAVVSSDKKIIANKLVIKGDIRGTMLYTHSSGNSSGAETMQFEFPFSQIVDIEGIDESFECRAEAEILSGEIQPRSSGNGSSDMFECNVTMLIRCYAYRPITVELAVDQYSTGYVSNASENAVVINNIPHYLNSEHTVKTSIDLGTNIADSIYGVRCKLKKATAFADDNKVLNVTCAAEYTLYACDNEQMPFICEKTENFTISIPQDALPDNCSTDITVYPAASSYNISSDDRVDIVTEMKISGVIYCNETLNGISEINVSDKYDDSENQDCALKLYFAHKGEKVWDIAKHYRAAMDAVTDENDIAGNVIEENCMLIIPMT